MFTRLLVPLDFSAPSDAALVYARTFAQSFDGALCLIHVTTDVGTPPHGAADLPSCEPAALGQLRARLTAEDHRRHVTLRVVEGSDPAHKIVRQACAMPADLIVMGTHGRSGMAHALMGSVAERVVRTGPCPVLTVHRVPPGPVTGFRRILVPTDFSGPSDAALDVARLLSLRFDAPIHLLHVLDDLQVKVPFGSEVFVSEAPDSRGARLADARAHLSHCVSAADRDHKRITAEVVSGPVASSVVQYAGDNGIDLIVMGTHGRTGLAHLLMGSVAERIVRSAACPVITTHDTRPSVEILQRCEQTPQTVG